MAVDLTKAEIQLLHDLISAVQIGQLKPGGLEIIMSLKKKLDGAYESISAADIQRHR